MDVHRITVQFHLDWPFRVGLVVDALPATALSAAVRHRHLQRRLDRAPEYVALARSLGDVLTPEVLGDAARSGEHDPEALKKVWHLLRASAVRGSATRDPPPRSPAAGTSYKSWERVLGSYDVAGDDAT